MGSRTRLLSLSLLLGLAACQDETPPTGGNAAAPSAEAAPGQVELRVLAASGATHRFTVELAVDSAQQQKGLMARQTMADDHGMIFPFLYPETASFWMKDTPMPLDLLFIRPDGTIAAIREGKPNDLRPISAGEPVSAVLEIKQGRAQALGISTGDRVQWGDCAAPEPAANAWRADRFCPPLPQ